MTLRDRITCEPKNFCSFVSNINSVDIFQVRYGLLTRSRTFRIVHRAVSQIRAEFSPKNPADFTVLTHAEHDAGLPICPRFLTYLEQFDVVLYRPCHSRDLDNIGFH